jgi:hypothetical protein
MGISYWELVVRSKVEPTPSLRATPVLKRCSTCGVFRSRVPPLLAFFMRGFPPHKTPPNKKTTRQGKPLFPNGRLADQMHFSLRWRSLCLSRGGDFLGDHLKFLAGVTTKIAIALPLHYVLFAFDRFYNPHILPPFVKGIGRFDAIAYLEFAILFGCVFRNVIFCWTCWTQWTRHSRSLSLTQFWLSPTESSAVFIAGLGGLANFWSESTESRPVFTTGLAWTR